ncbi:hypothetical protein [Nonomuraea ceibae]|uniref:hypothetical protein n=1 Tax=Nonomuraea ceibae TaxID=1935170 RepID=UPI003557825B
MLAARLRTLLPALEGTGEPSPLVRDWAALLTRYKARITELITSGRLSIKDSDTGPSDASMKTAPMQRTALFAQLSADPHVQRFRDSIDYQRYRLLLNYTYGVLTRLRVRPVERGLLCHLAAATVEDAFGVSAEARFRDFLNDPRPLEGSHR